jgi:glycine cleavage system H lipoate-binding protein
MTVLFVIATILIFLSIDWIIQRWRAAHGIQQLQPKKQPAFAARVPKGIFFTPWHTWLHLFPSGKVQVGVDDFIAQLLTSPEIIMLKDPQQPITCGEPMMLLKNGDHLLTVRSPITGKIIATNDVLKKEPSLLKEKLFSDGWGYIIEPASQSEIKNMLLGSETKAWMKNEYKHLRDILAGIGSTAEFQPALLQDGGFPMEGSLDKMPGEMWKHIDQEFLQTK